MAELRFNLNNAVSQYDRAMIELAPGYAKIDNRSFDELLEFSVGFAELIYFYDLNDKPDGDWVGFFLSDPVVVAAVISTIDLKGIEAEFWELQQDTRDTQVFDGKFQYLESMFQRTLQLARLIDRWLGYLDHANDFAPVVVLRKTMESLVKNSLAAPCRRLAAYAKGAAKRDKLDRVITLDTSGFSHFWSLSGVSADTSIFQGDSKPARIDSAIVPLRKIFDDFTAALKNLRSIVKEFLSNGEFGRHRPQIALFMAFAELFRHGQNSINTVSERYLKFYYDQVLQLLPGPAIAAEVYLAFTMADDDGSSSTLVPSGTLFDAGSAANGETMLYRAQRELLVTSARVAQLHTLHQVYAEFTPDGSEVPQQLLASDILVEETYAGEGLAFPTFGSSSLDTDSEVQETRLASLGFAVSSPALSLNGGERCVTLVITCNQTWYEETLMPLLQEISDATGVCPEEAFKLLLMGAFSLTASTQGSWFDIPSYGVEVEMLAAPDHQFSLYFNLDDMAPPLMAFDSEFDLSSGEAIEESQFIDLPPQSVLLPTLKAYLKQQPVMIGTQPVYPLSLLADLAFDDFVIGNNVHGLSGLLLSNTDGDIDQSSPFNVFGGLPVVGSYLQIAQPELFVKQPDTLTLSIAWFNLPDNSEGFKGYYQYYIIGPDGTKQPDLFNNQSFQGDFSVLNWGNWGLQQQEKDCPQNPDNDVEVFLFRTQCTDANCPPDQCADSPPSLDGALCPDTLFNELKVCQYQQLPDFYDPSQSAIRLTLTEPGYGFGNSLYAQNVLAATIEALPDTNACSEKCLAQYQGTKALLDALNQCLGECMQLDDMDKTCACIRDTLSGYLATFGASIMRDLRSYLRANLKDLSQESIDNIKMLTINCLKLNEKQKQRVLSWNVKDLPTGVQRRQAPSYDAFKGRLHQYMQANTTTRDVQASLQDPDSDDVSITWDQLEKILITARDAVEKVYQVEITQCMDLCLNDRKELNYPNEPWLPQASSVTVNYTASFSLFDKTDVVAPSLYTQLLPFSGYQIQSLTPATPCQLLPSYDQQGYLYIGLSGSTSPQSQTLLFQLAESMGISLPPVQWSVLSANQWQVLDAGAITSDTTNNLQNVGILALDLPKLRTLNNTQLSNEYRWLSVTAGSLADAYPNTMAIYPNALLAELQDPDAVAEAAGVPLPAGTITSSVEDLPLISEITQPMTSFGGKAPQSYAQFEISTSERLRHKDRAIQSWDYERLVLSRFPEIWQVMAVPAHNGLTSRSPGNVLLAVIPGDNSSENLNSITPMATAQSLAAIADYVAARASPFVSLHVSNMVYVQIQVTAQVIFVSGDDAGEDVQRLNSDLIAYLSPWFYDVQRAAKGGDYVNESDITAFIQNQTYVAELVSVSYSRQPTPDSLDSDWYFLTSAESHVITAITTPVCANWSFDCSEGSGMENPETNHSNTDDPGVGDG